MTVLPIISSIRLTVINLNAQDRVEIMIITKAGIQKDELMLKLD